LTLGSVSDSSSEAVGYFDSLVLVMSNHKQERIDANVPEGTEFLHAVMRFASQCEQLTDTCLASESPEGLISTHVHLGTLLSLLDRVSSCWWGCHQGDHTAEQLVGRCCSYGMGAFKLARSGFYDESVALARIVGEITNLALLFVADPARLEEWKTTDERMRKSKYSPVAVRLALEKTKFPVPVDQRRYGQLSAHAVHVTPNVLSQMYNATRHSQTGGVFQPNGLFFCLSEIGYPLSVLGPCAVQLCGVSGENGVKVCQAAEALSQSLHVTRKLVNLSFPGTYSSI
jgi:hypothetical protein